MKEIMPDAEVRQRLDKIKSYNAYFARERDKEGQPLTQHIVGPAQLWRIMTIEWGVDPTKFGIDEPPPRDPNASKKEDWA